MAMRLIGLCILLALVGISVVPIGAAEKKEDGCWQTPPNCLRMTKRIRPDPVSRYRDELLLEMKAKNRCGGRVLVRVCFERSNSDTNCYKRVLSDNERASFVVSGTLKPRADGDWWYTKRVSYAWNGIPEDYTYRTYKEMVEYTKRTGILVGDGDNDDYCETGKFDEIEYEFGG